jgi:putative ABC transport system substrate-binding protein
MGERPNRRAFIRQLALLAALPLGASAQPAKKLYRIGYLRRTSPEPADVASFRGGLRDFGYGENTVIEERYAHGVTDRLGPLAAELVRMKVDLIVVDGTATAVAVKSVSTSVPVVFVLVTDPVGNGLVKSLARPGTNFTGLTITTGYELAGKRLELFKAAFPAVSRLAILGNPTSPITGPFLRDTERAARTLGLEVQAFEAKSPSDLSETYAAIARWRADGLMTLNDAMFYSQRERIVDLSLKHRLPAIYPESEFVEAGGLMSYGPDFDYLFRRAAFYVDKILKGAKPADLPVEQPTKFELVINLKAAKQIGLTIPPSVLARADKVIK